MLKITIFIICLLAILVQLKRIEKLKENFVSNIIENDNIERFENNVPSVRDMKDNKPKKNNLMKVKLYQVKNMLNQL